MTPTVSAAPQFSSESFGNLVIVLSLVAQVLDGAFTYLGVAAFGLTEGNIFHGELSLEQLFHERPVPGWGGYRTPVRNLYLCASGVHPGGGVMGAPGQLAAERILADRA